MDGYRLVSTERQQQSLFTLCTTSRHPNRRGRLLSQDFLELFARIWLLCTNKAHNLNKVETALNNVLIPYKHILNV